VIPGVEEDERPGECVESKSEVFCVDEVMDVKTSDEGLVRQSSLVLE
jgi:hypothetical protein